MSLIFTISFILIVAIIIGVPILYPALLNFLIRIRKHRVSQDPIGEQTYEPRISVIIPVYNEGAVIERRIRNIYESTYPKDKIEIIVVDSGSTDDTHQILQTKFGDEVKIIQEGARNGKAHAINIALEYCTGEIVILTDGPTMYDQNTILEIVKTFADPSVGGATVKYSIPDDKQNRIIHSEQLLWRYKDKIRIRESELYSTSYLSGEACAFRKGIIGSVAEDTLADDSNIAFQIISKGHRVVVTERSHFVEKSPSKIDDYLRVKGRRALGGLQEILRFRQLIFNPRYGAFGLIIMPYRFFAELVAPILSLIALGLIVPLLMEVTAYLGLWASILFSILLILAIAVFRNLFYTYITTQLILLQALVLLLRNKKDVRWVQSSTTRQIK